MICQSCNTSIGQEMNFCPSCGVSIAEPEEKEKSKSVHIVIAFYAVMLVFFGITFFVYQNGSSLKKEIVIESVFALIVIGFTFFDFKNILKLFKIPKINLLILLGVLIIPIVSGISVYYGIDFINSVLFEENDNYYQGYADYPNPFFWSILFVAIFPPIFEELAFRGVLFNQLSKITTTRVTITLAAFIFALAHLSVISLLWIFPFGLLLGFLRHKYNTLWLGMIIHFIHNLIVLSLDYYYFDTTLLEI